MASDYFPRLSHEERAKSVDGAVVLTGEVALPNTLDIYHPSAEVGKMSRCKRGGNRVFPLHDHHPAQ
jgi:hypothetical protein